MDKKEKTIEELIKEGATIEEITKLIEATKKDLQKEEIKKKELVTKRRDAAEAVSNYLHLIDIEVAPAALYNFLIKIESNDIYKDAIKNIDKKGITKYGVKNTGLLNFLIDNMLF